MSRIRQERLECSDQSLQELFKDRLPSNPVVQKPTVGLRRQRFHTLRRKDPPRPRHPAALLSFPTARSPRPHNPPFD